jgi:glycosyltransferase involved in cell wall biosynthesis
MPIRNEAGFIERSLGAVLAQDYPAGRMEVLVVDGMSTDGTRELVRAMDEKYPDISVNLLDNPDQIVPTAMNIGIQEARGDVVVRVDGHCEIPEHYVRTCVDTLQETDADNVGGMQKPEGEAFMERAIAVATSTPLFIGNSHFRYAEEQRYVDTVYLGAYPREELERIGMFDDELIRHQDYELNCRLRNSGGKILYLPELEVTYAPRSSWWGFAKQYFQYGFWKVRVMQKTADAFQIRHFAPTMLTLFVLGGLFLTLLLPFEWVGWLYGAGLALYLAAAVGASVLVAARRDRWLHLPVLPLIFATIHLGWGSGFWWGMVWWWLRTEIED